MEVGAGTGQFTILLAERLPRSRIVALDRFTGPYVKDKAALARAIAKHRLKRRIRTVVGDYQDWISAQSEAKYDAVLSCDFVAEIDSAGLEKFVSECHRLLKSGGVTVHSFLSPKPRNRRQRRLIEADSNPKWTNDPPLEWFSPPEDLVVRLLRLSIFKRVRHVRVKSGLVFRSTAARELLKSWGVKQSFWRTNRRALERDGLEIPDFSIVTGSHPS